MTCPICSHPNRVLIERAILNAPTTETLEQLANQYSLNMSDLQVHACMHSSLGVDIQHIEKESIARQTERREVDMLLAAANEYMTTLQIVGNKIAEAANKEDLVAFSRSVSKATVDLYLGAGGELRSLVKEITDINNILNGPQDGSISGLQALANAIRGSQE